MTHSTSNNLPIAKLGKVRNYDLFYVYVTGHQDYKTGMAEVKCLESVTVGILMDDNGYYRVNDDITDFTNCAALDFL